MKTEIIIEVAEQLEQLLREKAKLEMSQHNEMSELNLKIINARGRLSTICSIAKKENKPA